MIPKLIKNIILKMMTWVPQPIKVSHKIRVSLSTPKLFSLNLIGSGRVPRALIGFSHVTFTPHHPFVYTVHSMDHIQRSVCSCVI